jgi:hypothetical protein
MPAPMLCAPPVRTPLVLAVNLQHRHVIAAQQCNATGCWGISPVAVAHTTAGVVAKAGVEEHSRGSAAYRLAADTAGDHRGWTQVEGTKCARGTRRK